MHSDLTISQTDPRPMFLQLMEQIRHRIAIGDWPPGYELPSIRALAAAVQVSVITVKRAYLELELDGVISTRQGKGSFVADSAGLATRLRYDELDGHLSAAVDVGRVLGLTSAELELRLRTVMTRKDETTS
jgi:GntR family transcriptional regulator